MKEGRNCRKKRELILDWARFKYSSLHDDVADKRTIILELLIKGREEFGVNH